MAKGKNQHVTPRNGGKDGWAVITEGATRASRVYDTQKEAIKDARDTAKEGKAELFIHGRDGQIRERDSYGNDPFPPRG